MSQFNEVIEEVANGINESVNTGFRRLGDLIQEEMNRGGSAQASGFEVQLNGVSRVVVSPSDPSLDQQVDPAEVTITKVASATAGIR